jgi:hypothetical protein
MKSYFEETGRVPRTLVEAFGPYVTEDFHEPPICIFRLALKWARLLFNRKES